MTPAEAEITPTSAESGPDWFCWSCFNVVIGINLIPVGAVNSDHLPSANTGDLPTPFRKVLEFLQKIPGSVG